MGYKRSGGYIIPSDWDVVPFSSLFSRLTRKNTESNKNVLTISAQQGLVSQFDYYGALYASEDAANYSLLHKGDFAYNRSYSSDYAYGAIKRLNAYDKGIVSPLYICFEPKESTNSDFYMQYFESGMFNREIYRIAQEGARNHGMLNVSSKDFFNSALVLPPAKEQQNVSEVLALCDQIIALYQRQTVEFKAKKDYFLQNMFPRQGERCPRIRFPNYTAPWEQRKFSEITYPAGVKNRDNLPLESYSITNENGFVPQDEKFENGGTMREADKRMYYIVSPQSFAYNPARINVGSIGYQDLDKNVIVSSLYEVFKTVDTVDDRFLWHWFKSNDFHKLIEQFQEGGVRLYFYYDKLCMGAVAIPSKEEQTRIGEFFDHLDNLITLHQQKLDAMKVMKKSLMQLLLTGIVQVNT